MSKECREASLQGWILLGVGVVAALVDVAMALPLTSAFVVVVLAFLAALFLGAGLWVVEPRPFQIFARGFTIPTGGLLGRLLGPPWVRYDEVTRIRTLSHGNVALVSIEMRSGQQREIPRFMVGSEGLTRLRAKLPSSATFEDLPVDGPSSGSLR